MKTLVLSPHLDDAVLSAGQYMAANPGLPVLTIFAGAPVNGAVVTAYDQKTGFSSADDAIAKRRDEDTQALGLLKATPTHLGYCDSQYGHPASAENIFADVLDAVRVHNIELLLAPLGINHPDHVMVREAALRIATLGTATLLYEDLPNRVVYPELVAPILADLTEKGYNPVLEAQEQGSLATKLLAINAYKSQTWGMNIHTLCVPERFWRVGAVR